MLLKSSSAGLFPMHGCFGITMKKSLFIGGNGFNLLAQDRCKATLQRIDNIVRVWIYRVPDTDKEAVLLRKYSIPRNLVNFKGRYRKQSRFCKDNSLEK